MMQPEQSLFDVTNFADPHEGMTVTLCLKMPIPDGDISTLHQICAYRSEQIYKSGHLPYADKELPPAFIPEKCQLFLHKAKVAIWAGDRKKAITALLKAGGLILAAVARLRMEDAGEEA